MASRTRPPSEARLQRAARAGLRPGMTELRLCLAFGALWLVLRVAGPDLGREAQRLMRGALASSARGAGPVAALAEAAQALGRLLGLPLAALGGVAILGLLLPPRFRPLFGRAPPSSHPTPVSDTAGVLLALLWSCVRVVLLGLLVLGFVPELAPGLRSLPIHDGVEPLSRALQGLAEGLLGRAALAMAVLAPLGFWLSHHLHRRALRMTEEEFRREQRAQLGDPRVRHAFRRRLRPPDRRRPPPRNRA